jgi:8-oxo-dGTP pyrophosphatase MutT (NUDIX family)
VKQEQILATLAGYDPLRLPRGESRASAVLVPLRATEDGGAEVILTLRVEHPSDPHSGQVSFPGGRKEPDDDNRVHTALRETHEELGIPPERVRVIGRLDEMLTVTGYHVSPIVGCVPRDVELVPNPDEVARVFTVPVDELMRDERWEHRVHPWKGSEVLVWHFPHAGEDVWGATARMLRDMVELLRRD